MYIVPKAYSVGHCASEKGNPIIERLLTPEALSKINLEGRANFETGPHYIGNYTTLEDLFYNIKITPTEIYLPYMFWRVRDARFVICKCRLDRKQKKKYPKKQLTLLNRLYTLIPCKRMYSSRALGVDHFYMGASWQKKRNVWHRSQWTHINIWIYFVSLRV